jgi:hypothetical protein
MQIAAAAAAAAVVEVHLCDLYGIRVVGDVLVRRPLKGILLRVPAGASSSGGGAGL